MIFYGGYVKVYTGGCLSYAAATFADLLMLRLLRLLSRKLSQNSYTLTRSTAVLLLGE